MSNENPKSHDDVSTGGVLLNAALYEDAVDTLAKNRTAFLFRNDNIQHASVVIKKIIEYAKESVAIYDSDLSGDVSDQSPDFLDILRKSVKKGNKVIRMVVDTAPTSESSAIKRTLLNLASTYPNNIKVRVASPEFKIAVKAAAEKLGIADKIYFTVGDDRAYRLQSPLDKRKAFCNFNDLRTCQILLEAYDKEFLACSEVFPETGT